MAACTSLCVGGGGVISGPRASLLYMRNVTLLIHPQAPPGCTAPIKLLLRDSQCEEETCITGNTIFQLTIVTLMMHISHAHTPSHKHRMSKLTVEVCRLLHAAVIVMSNGMNAINGGGQSGSSQEKNNTPSESEKNTFLNSACQNLCTRQPV